MATLTYTPHAVASVETPARRSFFSRLVDAMIESRMRRAQIDIRRAQAMVAEPKSKLDYALLPFAGE
jgi:hypothetical protein